MRLVGFAYAGVEPHLMGLGPIPATTRVLERAGLTLDDIGLFELNEPFAVQVLTWCDGVGVAPDDPRLNPYGGAIACGHPLAATGIRLIAQLAHGLRERPDVRYGLTALCIGMGMGAALLWENAPWLSPTRFHLQALDTRAGPIALVTIDNGADWRKPTTFGRDGARVARRRASTRSSTRDWRGARAHRQAARLRRRRRHRRVPGVATAERAREGGTRGARAVRRARARFRSRRVAAVNGAALGGGARDRAALRLRAPSPPSVRHFGFPECFLGIIPGWGGTQLVPRLVGARDAPSS